MNSQRGFARAYTTGYVEDFKRRISDNLERLADESDNTEFAVPVALFLVIDEENGGNAIAREVVNRFNLLDRESKDAIDFFFLGWGKDPTGKLRFNLNAFMQCRDSLQKIGVKKFGGIADLFVLDAWYRGARVESLM